MSLFQRSFFSVNLQLNAVDEGPEESNHAKELDRVVRLDHVLLGHVAQAVQCRTGEAQHVAQEPLRAYGYRRNYWEWTLTLNNLTAITFSQRVSTLGPTGLTN